MNGVNAFLKAPTGDKRSSNTASAASFIRGPDEKSTSFEKADLDVSPEELNKRLFHYEKIRIEHEKNWLHQHDSQLLVKGRILGGNKAIRRMSYDCKLLFS